MKLPTPGQLSVPSYYLVLNRYVESTHYTHDHGQYCYSSDPMFTVPLKNRTATSLIGGRILAQKLAEQSPLTLDILTGELGGAAPLPNDHPLKGAAASAASRILHVGWMIADWAANGRFTVTMDQKLVESKKLPAIFPTIIRYEDEKSLKWEAAFCSMDLIFTLAGGQFTVPAGMAFHYFATATDDRGEPLNGHFTLELYFQSVPEAEREVQIGAARQLIDERNQIFEVIANEAITQEIARILDALKTEGLLSDEIVVAAKAYDVANAPPTTAANDDASVTTPAS